MCVSRDVVISKLAQNEQKKVTHVSRNLQVFHGASCFTVFPYDFFGYASDHPGSHIHASDHSGMPGATQDHPGAIHKPK